MNTHWRIVPVPEGAPIEPNDLSHSELIGISIILTHSGGPPDGVYLRAREKIQPQDGSVAWIERRCKALRDGVLSGGFDDDLHALSWWYQNKMGAAKTFITDREMLIWIHERLTQHHLEPDEFVYMHALRRIIHATPIDRIAPGSGMQSTEVLDEIQRNYRSA